MDRLVTQITRPRIGRFTGGGWMGHVEKNVEGRASYKNCKKRESYRDRREKGQECN